MSRRPRTRRSLLAAAAASTSVAGCSFSSDVEDGDASGRDVDGESDGTDGSDETGEPTGDSELEDLPETVGLEPVIEGLDGPVGFSDLPARDQQYVLEQSGRIVAFDANGSLETTALDHTEAVRSGDEMGLLGIALHPDFAENRRTFVRYSSPPREETPGNYSHTFVLAEFEASEDGQTMLADSERTILELPQPQANHNAGDVAFGPDGLLYVPTGDGGAAGDRGRGHPEDWYDGVDGGNGQDVTDHLLGGVLRIDVDSEPTEHPRTDADAPSEPAGDGGYAVPDDNPLVGHDGRDEYYAWGLRNPWRVAFDDGALYVADVGQDDWEEVDRVERGHNYGWNVREGPECYAAETCPERVDDSVPAPRGGEPLRDPVVAYPHSGAPVSGISVIGGHVYRGAAVPELQGAYVFGDLRPDGRLFAAVPSADDDRWQTTTIDYDGALVSAMYAIARDADGELYVLGTGSNDGAVWRVKQA